MKSLKQIQQSISELERKFGGPVFNSHPDAKGARKDIKMLRLAKGYIELGGSEEYLKRKKDWLESILKSIEDGFDNFQKNTPSSEYGGDPKKIRPYYHKVMKKSQHEAHLRAIKFILS